MKKRGNYLASFIHNFILSSRKTNVKTYRNLLENKKSFFFTIWLAFVGFSLLTRAYCLKVFD